MILKISPNIIKRASVLHVCGDDPLLPDFLIFSCLCSPRMWRWSFINSKKTFNLHVFSTYVEMIPSSEKLAKSFKCVLHVCGDDPVVQKKVDQVSECSPRMWRWSWGFSWCLSISRVFSTYVEMIPLGQILANLKSRVLHVCGDDPLLLIHWLVPISCSPRMWRWSY